jgi:predicted MPP superfamily phosphohydrolase
VVLMHAPSGLRELADERFDLALCGHTHGGQVAMPGRRPVWVPESPQFRRFVSGRFKLDMGRRMYVSRGVGYSTAPVRSFCPSEVVGVELRFLAPLPVRSHEPVRVAPRREPAIGVAQA